MNFGAVLPTSWLECSLGDVIDYGSTRRVEPAEIPADAWVLELEDIEKETSRILQRLTLADRNSKSTKNRFDKGDVLYGKLRPYLNKVVRAVDDGYCTTEILPLKPTAEINGGYLFHWLKHPRFLEYVTSVSHGLNMPRLGTEAGRAAPFILAPIPEQKRISDKLDGLLARVDVCRERLDRVPGILKRFRQSVLSSATSGELTREWRDAQGVTWDPLITSIGALGEVITGSTPTKKQDGNFGGTVPFFKPSELDAGYWVEEASEHLSELGANRARLLPTRSVLVTCIGATIGKSGLSRRAGATNQQINAVICDESIALPEWLYFWCSSPIGQASIINNASATTLPILNKSRFAALPVEVPSLDEQRAIVSHVCELFDLADRLVRRTSSARTLVGLATPSAIAKAFRGELVPRDPNDEPASKLFVRLRTLANSTSITRKPRRVGARALHTKAKADTNMLTRKDVMPNHLTTILKERGALTAEALWSASRLNIDDFYDQLKDEEAHGLLRESNGNAPNAPRLLEPAA